MFNGRAYVGSSASCLFMRLRAHYRDLERGDHHNPHLQYAWLKYGADSFVFEIAETIDASKFADRWLLSAHVVRREQFAIDVIPAFLRYNIDAAVNTKIGTEMPREARKKIGDYFRGRPLSENHKEKLRLANKGQGKGRKLPPEVGAKMSAARFGKKLPEEWCINISNARRGLVFSEEHRANLSAAQKRRQIREHAEKSSS